LPGVLDESAGVDRVRRDDVVDRGEVVGAGRPESMRVVDLAVLVVALNVLLAADVRDRSGLAVLPVAAQLHFVAAEVERKVAARLVARRVVVADEARHLTEPSRGRIGLDRLVAGRIRRAALAGPVFETDAGARPGRYRLVAVVVTRPLHRQQPLRSEELVQTQAVIRSAD